MSTIQTLNEKLVVFGAMLDQALNAEAEAKAIIKARWKETAQGAIDTFGADWIHFAMLSKRDPAIAATAKRHVDSIKGSHAENAKTFREYASGIKATVKDKVEARADDKGNYREQYSRFLAYCVELSGLSSLYVPKDANAPGTGSGTTSYDKVAEALRVLRNHLSQCEPQAVENLLSMWPDIEEAAIDDGLLKEAV